MSQTFILIFTIIFECRWTIDLHYIMSANGLLLKVSNRVIIYPNTTFSSGDVAGVDINSSSDWLLGSWHYDLIDEKSGLSQIQYQERAITVCLTEQCDDNNRLQSCIWRKMTTVYESSWNNSYIQTRTPKIRQFTYRPIFSREYIWAHIAYTNGPVRLTLIYL